MKIFVDAHFLDGRKHGAANFLERLYWQYMDQAPDHDIYFGVEPNAPVDYPLFQLPGAHIVRYRYGGARRFFIDIPSLARRIKPDIVHTQYVLPLRWGYTAKRHVTLFDVLYEDFPKLFGKGYRWTRHLIFGWSARRADLLSTCSEYSRDRILAVYRPSVETVHVIHGGVMENPSLEEKQPDDPKVLPSKFLLYVSRFEKRKNHLNLLEAFVSLRSDMPELRLILVGFDVDNTLIDCQRFIVEHGIGNYVDVLSNITDAHLTRLFRQAAVVVYPSLCEGFGMPIIESMLHNQHTIFSNTTAMSDFSFARENMFNPMDVKDIENKIRASISAETESYESLLAKRQFIADKYNWKKSARTLINIHSPEVNQSIEAETRAI